MKRYNNTFTNDDLLRALQSKEDESKVLLENPEKWASFKQKMESFLHKSNKVPVLGSVIDDLVSMVQIADAYVKKEYTDIPWATIISIVGALVYVLSPIDIIPDFIPVIGYVDDVAVVLLVLRLGAGHDLEKFKKWQEENRLEAIDRLQKSTGEAILSIINGESLGALILCGDNQLRVLSIKTEAIEDEPPYNCNVHLLNMPTDILRKMYIESEDDYLCFLNGVAEYEGFTWSPIGKLEAIHESDLDKFEDYFSLMEED